MANWSNFPFDSSHYQREKAKIESELQERYIFSDSNVAFYEKEGSIEIIITAFSFKGNGLDIGMAIINTVFAFITQGIDELKKAGHLSIKGAGFTKWIFTLESLAITFTYNQGTQDWAKGVAAVVFDTTVMGVTRAIIGIIGVFIGMSWSLSLLSLLFSLLFLAIPKWAKIP